MRYQASRGRRAALLIPLAALLLGVASATVSCTGSAPVPRPVPEPVSTPVTSTSTYYPLLGNRSVFPTNPPQDLAVDSAVFSMKAGEVRRVTDQLDIRMPSAHGQEMNNHLICYGPNFQDIGEVSTGTNYYTNGGRAYQWNVSMLITAPVQGNYLCLLYTYVNDSDTSYAMTVLAPMPGQTTYGTWLEVSNSNEAGAQMWQFTGCPFQGITATTTATVQCFYCPPNDETTDQCFYIGGDHTPQNPPVIDLPNGEWGAVGVHGWSGAWTAADNATTIDGVATFQITTCPSGTESCATSEHGDKRDGQGFSWLEIDQLYPDGAVCQVNRAYDEGNWDGLTPSENYYITDAQHHYPLYYHVSAPVSQNCEGSRLFDVDLHIQWTADNGVKLDGGNVNVINSQFTTCPPFCVSRQHNKK